MSGFVTEGQATTRAFAQALVTVAYRKGKTVDDLEASFSDTFWSEVCEWLNAEDLKTPEGQHWTVEIALRFWESSKDTVMPLCREHSDNGPLAPAKQRILELWDDGIPVLAILAILIQEGFTDAAGEQFSLESIAETIDAHEKRHASMLDGQESPETASMTDSQAPGISFSPQPGIDAYARLLTEQGATELQGSPQGLAIPSIPGIDETPGIPGLEEICTREASLEGNQFVTMNQLQSALSEMRVAFGRELSIMADDIRNELNSMLTAKLVGRPSADGLPPLPPAAPLQGLKKLGTRVKVAGTIDAELMALMESERKARNISLSAMIDTMAWHYFGKPKLSFEVAEECEEPK